MIEIVRLVPLENLRFLIIFIETLEMDIFGLVAIVWLVSTVLASGVGFLHGRGDEAMTLGALLGPIGFLLTLVLVVRSGRRWQRATARAETLPLKPRVAAPREDLRRVA
jgi:hypothetical protein